MSELEDKLNTLLSDPDAMAQVMSMAQNLSQQFGAGGPQAGPSAAPESTGAAQGPAPDGKNPLSALTSLDPELLRRFIPVLRQMNRPESSEAAAFLYALRPFLKSARRDKVDRAVQLARLIHLAKTFLGKQDG